MERSTQQILNLKNERAENEAKIEQLTHQNERLKAREQYLAKNKIKADHEKEIQKFQMAARKLKPHFCDGKLPITKWRNELEALERQYEKDKVEINSIKTEACSLTQISIAVKSALQDDEKKYREVQQQRYTADRRSTSNMTVSALSLWKNLRKRQRRDRSHAAHP